MRTLLVIGILMIVLGVVSLLVGVPQRQSSGIKIGGARIGVQTQTSERIPLPASIALIMGGVVLAAVGGRSAR
ncbi:MAG: hypothetical protein LAN64_10880 [Acidobacteriia bacterium]|nr:hypothetical protein [Terriglobia bacterium]